MSVTHTYKGKDGPVTSSLTPLSGIRQFCFQCYGWCENIYVEVNNCPSKDCALWPFRTGKTGRKVTMTDEQRKATGERLARMREAMRTTSVKPENGGDLT